MIPGGPGMSSEYFRTLATDLQDNFSIWFVDLPGNGGNETNVPVDYSAWPKLILDIPTIIAGKIVYLGHSFAGMLLLSEEKVQNDAAGLVNLP